MLDIFLLGSRLLPPPQRRPTQQDAVLPRPSFLQGLGHLGHRAVPIDGEWEVVKIVWMEGGEKFKIQGHEGLWVK